MNVDQKPIIWKGDDPEDAFETQEEESHAGGEEDPAAPGGGGGGADGFHGGDADDLPHGDERAEKGGEEADGEGDDDGTGAEGVDREIFREEGDEEVGQRDAKDHAKEGAENHEE